MGNNLVEFTDQILKGVTKLFKTFKKMFSYVQLEQFIFQEANYLQVSVKEVEEIRQIFTQYEITIKGLQNRHLYHSPRSHKGENSSR